MGQVGLLTENSKVVFHARYIFIDKSCENEFQRRKIKNQLN